MNRFSIFILILSTCIGVLVWVLLQKKTSEDFELDRDKQQFIWDSEHVTFEIETYFGKPLAEALKSRDKEAFRKLVGDPFQARVFSLSGATEETVKGFRKTSWDVDDELVDTDVDGLAEFFLTRMKRFDRVERARTRVLKIFPVADDPHSWDTELLVTVNGTTAERMPIQISSHHEARFTFVNDEEIHNGKAARSWTTVDLTLKEATYPMFEEITRELGLDRIQLPDNWEEPPSEARQFRFQVAVEDFDRDGDYDIAVATYEGLPYLLVMEDGKYVERSRELGLKPWQPDGPDMTALTGWIDFDNDGYPDLVCGTYLYRNVGGIEFRDITESSGFTGGHDPHGMSVVDYNGDGLLDIYVSRSNEYRQAVVKAGWVGDDESGAPNTLWKNLGKGKFEDVTAAANAGGGNRTTFASSWFFLDDDPYPDLYLANDFARNVVLRNKGDGTFEDVSANSGAADFATSMGVATGDINNDGTTEIYVANMYSKMGRRIIAHLTDNDYPENVFPQIQGSCAGNRLYQMNDDGTYQDVTDLARVNEVGWAFAPLMMDFDGDGLLDIYATTGFMSFRRDKPDG